MKNAYHILLSSFSDIFRKGSEGASLRFIHGSAALILAVSALGLSLTFAEGPEPSTEVSPEVSIDPAVQDLVDEAFSGPEDTVELAERIMRLGPKRAENAVEVLIDRMLVMNSGAESAAATLTELGSRTGKSQIPRLVNFLRDPTNPIWAKRHATYAIRQLRSHLTEKTQSAVSDSLLSLLTSPVADIELAQEAIQALGAMERRAVSAIPRLTDIALNHPDPKIQEAATQALPMIGPEAKRAVPILVRALFTPSSRVRYGAVMTLDDMIKRSIIDSAELITLWRKQAAAENKIEDPCKMVCDIASNRAAWVRQNYLRPDYQQTSATAWETAVLSLAAYFVIRAEPLCPGKPALQGIRKEVRAFLGAPSCTPPPRNPQFPELARLSENLREITSGGSWSGSHAFAFQFQILMGNELKLRGTENHQRVEALLKSALDEFPSYITDGQGSSAFSLGPFAGFAGTTQTPSKEAIERLVWIEETAQNSPRPDVYPYYPVLLTGGQSSYADTGETEDSSSVRNVVTLLTLLRKGPPEKRIHYRDRLVAAIDRFRQALPRLMLHTRRDLIGDENAIHTGNREGIAENMSPTYLHFALPYVADAIKYLNRNERGMTGKQIEILTNAKDSLILTINSFLEPDGTIAGLGAGGLPSSTIYTNPLSGLALMSLMDRCDRSVVDEYAVIKPETP